MYLENKNRGLNIVGVSLDKEKNKWVRAIEDDGLVWDHVSNLMFWNDPIAKLYKASAIPATFVLDKNGVIVARDLRGMELYKKVEELLSLIFNFYFFYHKVKKPATSVVRHNIISTLILTYI